MTVRIAFTADSQIDERHRLVEHDRVMNFIADEVQVRGCTLTLHGGDIYERRSTETERRSVREWVERVATAGDVVICAGNHEVAGEVEEIERASDGTSLGSVTAYETPVVMVARRAQEAEIAVVAVLPWPRREHLRAWLVARGLTPGPEETSRTAAELLRDILRDFARRFDEMDPSGKLPRILLAHVEVAGYRSDVDQPGVASGIAIGVEDLMLACADIVLLGHIHLPQEWIGTRPSDGAQVPVIYAGSPRRTAFASGELVEKGFVVVEFAGRTPTWTRVPTPATPLVLVEATWTVADCGDGLGPRGVMDGIPMTLEPAGAEIRIRYTVAADQREAAQRIAEEVAAAWREADAIEVRVEPVILPTTRARAPEVAAAIGVEAQARAVWTTQGVETARQDRMATLVRQIEECVR